MLNNPVQGFEQVKVKELKSELLQATSIDKSTGIPELQRNLFQAIKTGDFGWIQDHRGEIVWPSTENKKGKWLEAHPLYYCAAKGNIKSFEILAEAKEQNFPKYCYDELIKVFILKNDLPDHLSALDLPIHEKALRRIDALKRCPLKMLKLIDLLVLSLPPQNDIPLYS